LTEGSPFLTESLEEKEHGMEGLEGGSKNLTGGNGFLIAELEQMTVFL